MHRVFTKCKLISKGAEAYIYLCDFLGWKVVRKVRIRKGYRIPKLDIILRKMRTKREAKLLSEVKKLGIPAPVVYDLDLKSFTITMEFIDGVLLRRAINEGIVKRNQALAILEKLGEYVGILHLNGIIHGDLTTSNVILTPSGNIVLIDFGLGEFSKEAEDMGIELRVLWTALTSAHYWMAEELFEAFLKGYRRTNKASEEALKAFEDIKLRGRYVAKRRLKQLYIAP